MALVRKGEVGDMRKQYHKHPKNLDTPKKNAVIALKFEQVGFTNASRSSVIWVFTVCPDLSVRKVRIIMVDSVQGSDFKSSAQTFSEAFLQW